MKKRNPHKERFDVGRTLPTSAGPPSLPIPSAPQAQAKRPRSPKRIVAICLLSLFIVFVIAFVTIAVWDGINISRATKSTFGSGNVFSLMTPTSLRGTEAGRVNVLVLGDSSDDPQNTGKKLTDSILVVSLSTTGRTSYMLSIPRDLYIQTPAFSGKINAAYEYVGVSGLESIISSDLKMPISYWAMVDNSAVRDIVNALGGIWIDIKGPDPRGLYDPNINIADGGPLKLSDGWHKLNGQTALNLSRARGDSPYSYGFPRSDFNRTQHQRQIVTAIKKKLSWTLILNPLKNGRLFQALSKDVRTNIGIHEVRPLFSLFNHVPSSQLQSVGLDDLGGKDYLVGTQYYGDTQSPAAGISDFSQIDAALAKLSQ